MKKIMHKGEEWEVVSDDSIRDRIIGDHEPIYRRVSNKNNLVNTKAVKQFFTTL